ncbi:hypothetical protein BABINDRAFT_163219 [Babjeviella inositovora NRRL Y-12698]|uniref:Metal-dependent protein hydrolase n=1 Tax=Babjeviella inositovora NRRL Y-12698 TaxID=984486 RepID=A0A1E3QL66_9ASCO|nr:uncharacterized protein BABINDRAFT_163219 [Babjeviella inositovora NRRL Y-12698]ODQ77832.1 hypothetical protein BABINDRAFT_163219 [Babjeviella inositovora NRRL Y-12698]
MSEPVSKKLKLDSEMLRICTHSGSFHADESLAVYLLKSLKKYADAEVVRSRDPAQWEEADIVVDVSGKYDGEKFFDHHQREFDEVFSADYKTKLSSAGLVYKHFGKEIISEKLNLSLSDAKQALQIDLLYLKIYKDFVEALDANDNGINNYAADIKPNFHDKNITLPSIVSHLNPSWNTNPTDADYDRQFHKASALMGEVFMNLLDGYGNGWLPARTIVEDAFNARFDVDPSGKIMVLDQFCPWKEHLYCIEKEADKENEILYVLFGDSSGAWRISTVSLTSTSFQNRKALPEPWRGIRDDALSQLTGVPGCIFVHAAGFIGGAKTREAVIQLAKMSI